MLPEIWCINSLLTKWLPGSRKKRIRFLTIKQVYLKTQLRQKEVKKKNTKWTLLNNLVTKFFNSVQVFFYCFTQTLQKMNLIYIVVVYFRTTKQSYLIYFCLSIRQVSL